MLIRGSKHYDKLSHATLFASTVNVSLAERGKLFLRASFDSGKMKGYKKEVSGRVGLARVFENFINGIRAEVDAWLHYRRR